MTRHPRIASAFSLIEVTMASAIMTALMAAVLESMVAARHLQSSGSAKDALESDAALVLGALSDDLTMSGWHLPSSEDFNRNNTLDADEDLNLDTDISPILYAGASPVADREAWYYPYVVIQDPDGIGVVGLDEGLGLFFQHVHRTPGGVVLNGLPSTLPGNESVGDDLTRLFVSNDAAWKRSFRARSQEIVFLRATIGQWDPNLDQFSANKKSGSNTGDTASHAGVARVGIGGRVLNFDFYDANADGQIVASERLTAADWKTPNNHANNGALYPCGWAEVLDAFNVVTSYTERTPNLPYGAVLDAGWYDPEALGTDDDLPVKIQWETVGAPTFSANDYSPSSLREYMYAVVPSPLGLGRLVRAYKIRVASLPVATATGFEINNALPVRDAGLAAGWCMRIDRVLSDNVVRVTFDTYRTIDFGAASGLVTTLSPNQILVRVYLAKRQLTNPNVVYSKRVETIISMRARSSQSDVLAVQTALGVNPVGLVR